ncbi:MAG: tetratricopeptide repeat protein [Acidobacteriota bacterium]|nr:tetratricopeptide repeat protein [Acidobacteriota bacterium]
MRGRGRSSLAAVLFAGAALGCAGEDRSAPQLPIADLSSADEALRVQIARHEERIRALHAERAAAAEVAASVGELGRLYHGLQLLQPEALYLLENALACYREAQRIDPGDWRWPYLEAFALDARGDLEPAARRYRTVLASTPNRVTVLLRLAEVERRLGRSSAAEALWREALGLDPDQPAAHYGLGRIALDGGDAAAAAKALERALELAPAAGRVHHALALARRDLGDREHAGFHLERANETPAPVDDPLVQGLALLPSGSRATLQRGLLAVQAGALDDAVLLLQRATEEDPSNPAAHRNLALALIDAGRPDEAIAALQTLAGLDPADAWTQLELGRLLGVRGRFDLSLAHLERAVELAPRHKQARVELGLALTRAGRPREALRQFETALDIDPFFTEVHNHAAVVLAAMGRPDEGARLLRERLAAAPGDGAAARALSRILRQQQRFDEARRVLAGTLAAAPAEPQQEGALRLELGRLLALGNQPARALSELNRARRLAPELFEAAFLAGLVYGELGRMEDAASAHVAALEARPDFGPARLALAEAQARRGECTEAVETIEAGRRLTPSDRDLDRALADLRRSCVEGGAPQ